MLLCDLEDILWPLLSEARLRLHESIAHPLPEANVVPLLRLAGHGAC